MPEQFEKYAGTKKHLSLETFNTMYAAFLFRNFDVNGDGVLDLQEAEKALAYLGQSPVGIALPSEALPDGPQAQKVSKLFFWQMYLAS